MDSLCIFNIILNTFWNKNWGEKEDQEEKKNVNVIYILYPGEFLKIFIHRIIDEKKKINKKIFIKVLYTNLNASGKLIELS